MCTPYLSTECPRECVILSDITTVFCHQQLLKDKTALSDKVATLNRRIESQNQAWQHKLDTEMVRIKETTLAGEKIRRERWVRENTKKIKVGVFVEAVYVMSSNPWMIA